MAVKIILLSLVATFIFADFTMVYEMDGGPDGKREEIIQYRDSANVRMSFYQQGEDNSSSDPTGQYIVNGTRYTVLKEDGKRIYMNMDKIDAATHKLTEEMNITSGSDTAKPEEKPFFTLIKKGAPQTISGIQGEIWEVESEEDGRKYREEIVVTNNKEVVVALQISIDMLKRFGEGPYGMEIDHDLETMMLVADGYALLSAKGIRFVSLNQNRIDDSVFKLPKDAVNGMKNLPKMDKEKEDAGKRILKSLLE